MRLIDADAINTKTFVDFVGNQGYISFGDALWMISELPTVEAKLVVHGEWIETCFGYACSHCKEEFSDELPFIHGFHLPKICPECGAIMDVVDIRGGKHD